MTVQPSCGISAARSSCRAFTTTTRSQQCAWLQTATLCTQGDWTALSGKWSLDIRPLVMCRQLSVVSCLHRTDLLHCTFVSSLLFLVTSEASVLMLTYSSMNKLFNYDIEAALLYPHTLPHPALTLTLIFTDLPIQPLGPAHE
jgi:hypothetical protein